MLGRDLFRRRHRLGLPGPGLPKQALQSFLALPVGSGDLGDLDGVG
jgi:hypothetical protein